MSKIHEDQLKITFHHICIETNVYKESIEFYTVVLGFEVVKETTNFHNRDFNTWLQNGDVKLEIQTPKHCKKDDNLLFRIGTIGIMHIAFEVDNIESTINKIKNLQYNNLDKNIEIYEVFGNKISKIHAPEGTIIEFREKNGLTTS